MTHCYMIALAINFCLACVCEWCGSIKDSPSKEVFEHVETPDDLSMQFLCDVCKNPLLDAEIAIPCGHSFCGYCVEQMKGSAARASTCQMCGQPVNTFIVNRKANSMLSTIEGICRWCNESFPLDTSKQHVTQCQQIEIKCPRCKQLVKRADINHDEVCESREIVCGCGENVMRRRLEEHKQTTCLMKEMPCSLKCGALIKRHLMPSHSLVCSTVVEKCTIVGCGQNIRRHERERHMQEQQEMHFRLITRERSKMLWNAKRGMLRVEPVRTNQTTVMKWKIGELPSPRIAALASPIFEHLNRKWKLLFHDGIIRLKYMQGLDPIAIVVSFVLQTREEKKHGYREVIPDCILLEEGEFTEIDTACNIPPHSVTVRIEVTEPNYK